MPPVERLVQQPAGPVAALGEADAKTVQVVVGRGSDGEPLLAGDPAEDLTQLAGRQAGPDDRAVQGRT